MSDYTSLSVTLRDLLQQCDPERVHQAIIASHYCEGDDLTEGYISVMAELLALPPTVPRYPILLSTAQSWDIETIGKPPHVVEEYIDVGFWNPDYVAPAEGLEPEYGLRGKPAPAGCYDAEADIHQQHFGMGLTPWAEIIDAAVYMSDVEAVTRLCPTLAHVLAEVLWEATFYGWSSEQVKATKDSIIKSMDDYCGS